MVLQQSYRMNVTNVFKLQHRSNKNKGSTPQNPGVDCEGGGPIVLLTQLNIKCN